MVSIRPFIGFRPAKDLVEKVASPPYDVLSSEEAREMAKDNPYSFLRVVKSEIDMDPDADLYGEAVYEKGSENLRKLAEKKALIHDEAPCFYVYAQKMGDHRQVGLVAGASAQEYKDDIIKKHEFTRPDKENDRARHIEILAANTGPVFLLYRHSDVVDEIIEKICKENPTYDFTANDGIQHTFWVVDDAETIGKIEKAFEKIPALYIADGHHRSAAAVRVYERKKQANPLHTGKESYNHFLTVIFPDNQMKIMAYNRIVKNLNGLKLEDFLNKVREKFTVEKTENAYPSKMHEFTMFINHEWHKLEIKPEFVDENNVVERLDASILQRLLLEPILGIENPRTNQNIRFVGGIRGNEYLAEEVKKQGDGVAFALYPLAVESLIAVADDGQVMPPKSTWFEPKLRSGMVVKPLA